MLKTAFLTLCLLIPGVVQANATELQQSLAAFFAAKPTAHGAVARLVSVKHWPDIKGNVRWSLPALRFLPARVSLIAEQGKGKSLRRWYVTAQVKWLRHVVTLKNDVSARTVLDKSMLIKKTKNIAGLRGRVWTDMNDVVGLKTLRKMHRGDTVLSTIVKRPPLIQRGDHVTILVETSGIQVRAMGVALKSGSRGDRMPVRNIRSKQTLQSTVQDAHTVAIRMGGA